jgi:Mrp family chromosome partitioning ATPase
MASGETKLIVRQITTGLSLLPAGRPTQDPMEALISERMRRLIDEARDAFDWVIIDTPPLVLLPDAHLLAPMADGVLMVVRAKSTPYAMAKRAVDAIGSGRLLGVVLNAARETDYPRYYHYDDYYGGQRPETTGVVAVR